MEVFLCPDEKKRIITCVHGVPYSLPSCVSHPLPSAQDETSDAKIIERYKSMLNRTPKEG